MSPTPHPLLLVDDDAAFRKVYGGLLRDAGYEVLEAADRSSARAAVEARAFPLVLLDLMLPPDGRVSAGLEQLGALLAARPGTKGIVVARARLGANDSAVVLEVLSSDVRFRAHVPYNCWALGAKVTSKVRCLPAEHVSARRASRWHGRTGSHSLLAQQNLLIRAAALYRA